MRGVKVKKWYCLISKERPIKTWTLLSIVASHIYAIIYVKSSLMEIMFCCRPSGSEKFPGQLRQQWNQSRLMPSSAGGQAQVRWSTKILELHHLLITMAKPELWNSWSQWPNQSCGIAGVHYLWIRIASINLFGKFSLIFNKLITLPPSLKLLLGQANFALIT